MARRNDFDEFMKEVAKDAYGQHFRLAVEVIRLRKKQRLTQQQLAKVSGVQQSEISRIERGQSNPTFRTLQQLAYALKKTIGFVDLGGSRRRAVRRSAAA